MAKSISQLDAITDEAIDLSQFFAIDDPAQTFKLSMLQLRDFLQAYYNGQFQPLDATLTTLAGLATAADKLPYFSGTDTAALTTLTAFARTLLDDADAAAARATLGALAKAGDTATGNIFIDRGANSEPQMGVKRDGGEFYLYDSGENQGVYSITPLGSVAILSRSVSGGGVTVGHYNFPTIVHNPLSGAAQLSDASALTRKDYVDGQIAGRAPTTHTHTAAQGNQDIVAGSYGQVGTYGFFRRTAGDTFGPGISVPGSQLMWCNAEGEASSTAPSGTWKSVGAAFGEDTWGPWNVTLFIRIA